MELTTIYLVGLLLTLLLSVAIVLYMRHPLFRILVDLCQTEDRAKFWATNSHILLVLVPLLFSMMFRPTIGSREELEFVFVISSQLTWAVFGLVGTILVQSFIINQFIPRTPVPPKENS